MKNRDDMQATPVFHMPLLYLGAALLASGCMIWPPGMQGDDDCPCGTDERDDDAGVMRGYPPDAGSTTDAVLLPLPDRCAPTIGWDASTSDDTDTNPASRPLEQRRVIVIGDLHGNLEVTEEILRATGLIDGENRWIGGDAILVQTGDQIDRGPSDREVIDLFEVLRQEAPRAGGAVVPMTANHEVMNIQWDFRFISPESFAGFSDIPFDAGDPDIAQLSEEVRGRAQAFRPGGPYANILATRPVVLKINGTLFSHAGITPDLTDEKDLLALNREASAWMRGKGSYPSDIDGPTWNRTYGTADADSVDCDAVNLVLEAHCATRMVVGHTIQEKINAACDGRLFRIDVGMYQGEQIGALEIEGDQVRFIEAPFPN